VKAADQAFGLGDDLPFVQVVLPGKARQVVTAGFGLSDEAICSARINLASRLHVGARLTRHHGAITFHHRRIPTKLPETAPDGLRAWTEPHPYAQNCTGCDQSTARDHSPVPGTHAQIPASLLGFFRTKPQKSPFSHK
jgi:hypothetical protein